jgi:hypothetical protein
MSIEQKWNWQGKTGKNSKKTLSTDTSSTMTKHRTNPEGLCSENPVTIHQRCKILIAQFSLHISTI